jgi:hypothetical protein
MILTIVKEIPEAEIIPFWRGIIRIGKPASKERTPIISYELDSHLHKATSSVNSVILHDHNKDSAYRQSAVKECKSMAVFPFHQ